MRTRAVRTGHGRDAGFSLIELLIVIVVLGVLGGIVVFGVGRFREDAANSADAANLVQLNRASYTYDAAAPVGSKLNDLADDSARMSRLFERGLLQPRSPGETAIAPQVAGATFTWHRANTEWVYSQSGVNTYDFKAAQTTVAQFRTVGTWTKSAAGFTSSTGILAAANPRSDYTVSVTAQLAGGSSYGGWGILINTSLTPAPANLDSGYAIQFDRGFSATGSIIIRPRVGGVERGPVTGFAFTPANTGGFIGDKSTPEGAAWWTAPHTMAATVTTVSPTKRRVALTIDGTKIFDNFEFPSGAGVPVAPVAPVDGFAGVRAWGMTTTFTNMTISGPIA